MTEAHPVEGRPHRIVVEASRSGGVGYGVPEAPEWQVRALRHEHDGRSRGQMDRAAAPGPDARHRPEQGALVRTRLAGDQKMIARRQLDPRPVEGDAAVAQSDAQILEGDRRGRALDEPDAARFVAQCLEFRERVMKGDHAQERRPPVGDLRETVDKPPERLLHLIEGADCHHQLAERQSIME